MRELGGRTAVVTGAASGIGLATATRFAREGMRVVLADIERDALESAVAGLEREGHEVLGVPTDVSRWDDVRALAERTLERFGGVHVLHNNAGVVVSGPVAELSLEDWEWVLGVDLWSAIYGVKVFLPLIKAQGEGHVVNTASTAGLAAAPMIGPYNVAKFGVVALSETLAVELAAEGSPIGASVLCPGAVNTSIVDSARNRPEESALAHSESPQEQAFQEGARKLLAQGMDPDEVADQVVHAIRSGEFWILTHPDWKRVLRERVEALATENRLATGFGG
jgi:NAD(P)-dependent dehydrogenase (short-subunit alcohol dehydrogenase family)